MNKLELKNINPKSNKIEPIYEREDAYPNLLKEQVRMKVSSD
jgi:hypothetical protein